MDFYLQFQMPARTYFSVRAGASEYLEQQGARAKGALRPGENHFLKNVS
jgi:hypothetical protein